MIENTVASIVYTADGAQTQWTIPFTYGHAEDVKLFVKVGTADIAPVASNLFSIDTELNTITYPLSGDPLAANDKVIVMRVTEQTQEESSVLLSFKSEDIERMADKLTMEVQELQEQLSRCIAYNPVDAAEGELDAQQYIDDLTDLKNTATSAAATATEQAGLASAAKTAAETAQDKAEKWAEGTDAQVAALGGTHSAEGWAGIAQTAAESENVQTVVTNISDINSVADNITDVTTVSNISAAVSNVADNDTEVLLVSDNMASVITTASNINNVNTVAGVSTKVSTVADNIADVGTVADNISDIGTVANVSTAVSTVANDINAVKAVNNNKTNIDAVATNQSNINAVASNETNINAVNANKTNIDTVAGNSTNINTVATNISDVSSVAADVTSINAVAADLTNIDEVADDLQNIDIVADSVPYKWQKPADWVDIRSFAPANSIVLLVGHKADYSKYPSFSMKAEVSNSGTYDVFVDGIKQATTASGTATTLTWQNLALTSGYDVTYPEALRTHIVRITPTLSTNTLTKLEGNYSNQGTLWAHITALNAIRYNQTFKNNAVLDVVTSASDEILVNFFEGAFQDCSSLKQLPIINCTTAGTYYCTNAFTGIGIKKVTIKNAQITYGTDFFRSCPNLEEIELINSKIQFQDRIFENCPKLKRLPPFWLANNHLFDIRAQSIAGYSASNSALQDTVVDFSSDAGYLNRLVVNGSFNGARVDGIKGVMVSPNSPLASGTSPQIDVQYTGLDRAALINLFKSMPYNVGYTVVGSPTITSGVASGFSSSNHLTVSGFTNSSLTDYLTDSEVVSKFNINSFSDSENGLTQVIGVPAGGSYSGIFVRNSGQLVSQISGTTYRVNGSAGNISLNTDYFVKQTIKNNIVTLYLGTSLSNLQQIGTLDIFEMPSPTLSDNKLYLGIQTSKQSPLTGSIYLNNTYINIKGVPWFTGKAAMTKTCNIVGCTGTADLTAEDKAIATDKGWALTLS